ncbi:MAG: hypothetical protein IPP49_21130 [Saprospiraceae bacterium]|nr:hypothetical protein [Saprospiraceae bacterium]
MVTKKVIRTWQILDWCNGTVTPCQQIIKSVDTEAPTFIVKIRSSVQHHGIVKATFMYQTHGSYMTTVISTQRGQ